MSADHVPARIIRNLLDDFLKIERWLWLMEIADSRDSNERITEYEEAPF